ncbi:putative aminoglycoside phosphotransferase [Rosellinia necatrix]|uniref:Putative aminoglycoside phosphotransferase n=1 Tax=Rosellinia necatrix TaxID=77044 RepID=A0A1W2TKK3_ROSNE|nr:putative aminoglycoside phosphotransferase [Rosellinia necatrix]
MVFQIDVCFAIVKALPASLRRQANQNLVDAIGPQHIPEVHEARLIAVGGYNSVFYVKLHEPMEIAKPGYLSRPPVSEFVIRLPSKDALLPHQIINDVACREYVAEKLPHIPVPRVYFYRATDDPDTSFTVEEFVDCPPLSSMWMSLSLSQKNTVAQKLASTIVDLAEIPFDMIGGLDSSWSSAPTVEGCKLFKGRGKFHNNQCYPIGPYKSIKEFILSSYDREIYYYTHGAEDIDMDFFDTVALPDFIESLKRKRTALAERHIPDEPIVLTHGDFHGRNILVRGDQIAAIIDWDFAGSYPLSETLGGLTVGVLDVDSEETYMEYLKWGEKIRDLIKHEAQERHWDRDDIDLLMGDGDTELGLSRQEMLPF